MLTRATTATRVLALLFLLSVAPLAAAADSWTRDDAAHLLRRAAFGGTPEQVDRLHALGKSAAVEYLLGAAPSAITRPAGAPAIFPPADLPDFKSEAMPPEILQIQRWRRLETLRLRSWWIDRMARTDRPLEEKMTLFWHGLFTSGIQEVKLPQFISRQNALFHAHALGNYRTLAEAVVRDPAMLRYLNADSNVKGKPNENLARELMELFTMGEGNGYTERDIAEVARALTGATTSLMGYVYRPVKHDQAAKVIFGKAGNYRPDDIVPLIFQRPEPPRYLARRLWEFFAFPNPTDADIAPVAAALAANNFELRPALRALFTSPAFYADKARFAVIKSPVGLVVSTLRTMEQPSSPDRMRGLLQELDKMGQSLLQPPNVKGWPGGEHWITSATLFTRYNACSTIVQGGMGFTPVSPARLFPTLPRPTADQLVDAAIARYLQRPLHPDKRKALIETLGTNPLTLGKEESDRRARQMLALLLSTPEYQVE